MRFAHFLRVSPERAPMESCGSRHARRKTEQAACPYALAHSTRKTRDEVQRSNNFVGATYIFVEPTRSVGSAPAVYVADHASCVRGSALALPAYPVARPVDLQSFLARAEALAPERSAERPVMDRLKLLESGEHDATLTLPALAEGEQYRFHFDMTRCIGCRCCEVACNEQNGNPAEVTWRRVGEVEGGCFPHVKRYHFSMACNHCLEPACLEGCPTGAYEKLANGIVKHHADQCIGCQYCTWNCPYGVPQFNPERRIVTKCHMCGDRMGTGRAPACVEACPVQAIQIEKVNVEEWRDAIGAANAPGVPPADLTLSTTRITLPAELPPDFGKAVAQKLEPEPAHWSLVYFLTVSQASVGLALAALSLALLGAKELSGWASLIALAVGHAALSGTLFHLGRPVHAFKAVRGFRRSWLSREVVAFSAYAGLAIVPGTDHLLGVLFDLHLVPDWASLAALVGTAITGLAGIYTSVRIYRIPARPAWESARTTLGFFLSAPVIGAAVVMACATLLGGPSWTLRLFGLVLGVSAAASALVPWSLAAEGSASEPAVRSAAQLLRQRFMRTLWVRTLLALGLVLAGAALAFGPAREPPLWLVLVGVAAACATEGAGRYLFFRCVVPRNMPLGFFAGKPVH
jgi:formate dehydrogenase iron-sulfur subunit